MREEREARQEAQEGADAARALAHVRDAVFLLDEDGGVRYANPAANSLLAGADVGGALEELGHGNVTVAGHRPVSLAGRERWLTFAETPFDGGRVVVLRDVSEDVRLERLRADFVATAAHELRTPLAAVYGAVRTLRHSEHELSEEMSAQFLAMIEDEAERLKLVMDQLLVSAQLDRDEVTLHREVVEIGELCKSVAGAVEIRKPEAIELAVTAPAEVVEVDADGERLRQVSRTCSTTRSSTPRAAGASRCASACRAAAARSRSPTRASGFPPTSSSGSSRSSTASIRR